MIRHKGTPRPGQRVVSDTHTVRDDSGNTTEAMTQRRADRDTASANAHKPAADGKYYVNPDGSPANGGAKKPNIKIGAEYTTYHEPTSPEGKAIVKDKAGKAKALKKVNKEYSDPKVAGESQARGESYDRARKDEAQWGDMAGPGSPSQTYKEGGSKAEMAKHQDNNRRRVENEAIAAKGKADVAAYGKANRK